MIEFTSKLGTKFGILETISREKYREYKSTVNKLLGSASMDGGGKVVYKDIAPDSLEEMDDIAVRLALQTVNGEQATDDMIKALDWKDFEELASFIQKKLFTTERKK